MHRTDLNQQPQLDALAALLDQADAAVAAQRHAYGTEQDDDTAWRCAWTTWRTLADLATAVRPLLIEQPTTVAPVVQLNPPDPWGRAA